MIDLEHCTILGRESIDSNSINRCLFNLFTKMGEFNTNFLNASSENVPEFPFFSGGYEYALTANPAISSLHVKEITTNASGVVPRLYRGELNLNNTSNTTFIMDSVTGCYKMNKSNLSSFAPTVDALFRDSDYLTLKSVLDEESGIETNKFTLDSSSSPVIERTSYMLSNNIGVSFGTITIKNIDGNAQECKITLNLKSDLTGVDGVDKIKFFKIGNGMSSGIRSISENYDMITDMGPCNVTYQTNDTVIISAITKNDGGDSIIIDDESGRILDEDENYDYLKCTKLTNDELVLNFFVIFDLKEDYLKYSDDRWCFYIVDSKEIGRERFSDAEGWAANYSKYKFSKFEAADDGKQLDDGTHVLWDTEGSDVGGCVLIASDAFNGCTNATFESLKWFSPRLRYANRMFRNCYNATFDSLPIELKLDNIRRASSMFQNCKLAKFSKIKSISLNTASKADYMFSGCVEAKFDSLTSLNINGDCNHMFYNDIKARFPFLGSISGSATNFSSMFENCSNALFSSLDVVESKNNQSFINAEKMFYNLIKPTFEELNEIGFYSVCGYDGTSMFESCSNASFQNLTSIGNVKYGNRMFCNLDNIFENYSYDVEFNNVTFEKLHSIGNLITDGDYMFNNDTHLTMNITSPDIPLINANNMFQNTSSVVIDGNMNSLVNAENMFQHVNTAVVKGDMNSLKDGSEMFSYCISADVSGTTNKLSNMTSMFANTDYAHFLEVPSSASEMDFAFANITGECYVGEWLPSESKRVCTNTFTKSNNVWINGNVINGNLTNTSYMFANCGGTLVLNNPAMSGDVYNEDCRFFSNNGVKTYYGLFQNLKKDSMEDKLITATFIGNVAPTKESISSYATSSDIEDSLLCFETQSGENHYYYAYSISKLVSSDDETATFNMSGVSEKEDASLLPAGNYDVYFINKNGISEKYGSVTTSASGDVVSIEFWYDREGIRLNHFKSMNVKPSYPFTHEPPSELPQIQSFTPIDANILSRNWKYASGMFYNVVQSSLLSGYDCILSQSLVETDSMFELDKKVDDDTTFNNAGNLFRKMERSSIKNMNRMFRNRTISDLNPFVDLYTENNDYNKSFLIPNGVTDAASAFMNCTMSSGNDTCISLTIPMTLTGGRQMFDGYSGPDILLNYNEDKWLSFNDNLDSYHMFNGCKFHNSSTDKYNIYAPNVYAQIFYGSNFQMDNVAQLAFPYKGNFAHEYSQDDFFYNEGKMLGCSSVTFKSLKNDITDWFSASSTTTESGLNVEGLYFTTVIGPTNTSEKNYELLVAEKNAWDKWVINTAYISSISDDMIYEMRSKTNETRMDDISSLANPNGRLTSMFNPYLAMKSSNVRVGDMICSNMASDVTYFDKFVKSNDTGGHGFSFNSISLKNVKSIDARELALTFTGTENTTFENLYTIGSNIINGYGAFMNCSKASFDNLTSVSIMQDGSEDTFESIYATTDQMSTWYGNYSYMFRNCKNASFENLTNISFNSVHNTLSGGGNIDAWIDFENNFNFYFTNSSKVTYRMVQLSKPETSNAVIYVKDIYGNQLPSFTTEITDSIRAVTYELAEIGDVGDTSKVDLCVIVTITTEKNRTHYFKIANLEATTEIKITECPAHPSTGYVAYDPSRFSTSAFYNFNSAVPSSSTPNVDTFINLDGVTFTISADPYVEAEYDEQEDLYNVVDIDSCYTFNICDTKTGDVIKVGTEMKKYEIKTDPNDNTTISSTASSMWYSRLCYRKDDINYMAITIYQLDNGRTEPTTRGGVLEYPAGKSSVCYRIYNYDGQRNVDEMFIIPGSLVSYRTIAKLDGAYSSTLSHKALCRGMFENCSNSKFDSLKSIIIPMSGSCAEMFSGCSKMVISDNINGLYLPYAPNKEISSDTESNYYHSVFSGLSSVNMDFGWMNDSNTNIYNIGNQKINDHMLGEWIFDGVSVSGVQKKISDGNPFTYQNAIYDIKMDTKMAEKLFGERADGTYYTAKFFSPENAKTMESPMRITKVEKEKVVGGTTIYNPLYIPKYAEKYEGFSMHWMIKDTSGNLLADIDESETSYYPVSCDINILGSYDAAVDRNIASHSTYTETVTGIVSDEDKRVMTSFNATSM